MSRTFFFDPAVFASVGWEKDADLDVIDGTAIAP